MGFLFFLFNLLKVVLLGTQPSYSSSGHGGIYLDCTIQSFIQGEEKQSPDTNPSESLDEVLKKDIDSEGITSNILSGLTLCYNALANILLYPIFSFLLVILSLGAIILGGFFIKKIQSEQPIAVSWILGSSLYLLLYFDLFLVVFQKSTILFLFLELEKDLIMFVIAALIGYVVGKYCSNKTFEEKKLP